MAVAATAAIAGLAAAHELAAGVIEQRNGTATHWAFERIERPAVPAQSGDHPVDALLAVKWDVLGVSPQPPAADEVLLRRLYLDLTGLPPSPEQIRAFVTDSSADKVNRLAEALLGGPRYPEHWGRHWMDIWRYSDWYGLGAQLRYSQKHIWHWRDWIFESLAEDKGYDRMVMEMLAGDELDPGNLDTARATGFLARSYFLFNRTTWLDSTIEHTGKAFLGLTINCAKCHDHKYDPVSQVDYYRMRAIFEPHQVRLDALPEEVDLERDGIPRAFDDHPDIATYLHVRGDESLPDETAPIAPDIPTVLGSLNIVPVSLPVDAWSPGTRPEIQRAHLNASRAQGQPAFVAMRARIAADNARFRDGESAETCAKLAKEAAQLEWAAELEHQQAVLEKAERELAASSDKEKRDRDAKNAEEAAKKLDALEKRGPPYPYTSVFGSRKALETPEHNFENSYPATYSKVSTGRRLALARWIASRDNPLAARVAVNHIWLRTMGQPLVADVTDFGLRARPPLHQDVLDFLAIELMEHDWSLKHLLRLITTSRAYQRTSSNLHASRKSLESDPENRHYWRAHGKRMTSQMLRDAVRACGDALDLRMGGRPVPVKNRSARRSVYFRHSRDDGHRFHAHFDNPSILECYRRQESVAPQQALALMNDIDVYSICGKLAERSAERAREAFIHESFVRILGRPPDEAERARCDQTLAAMVSDQSDELSARTAILLALFNHNDFITIR